MIYKLRHTSPLSKKVFWLCKRGKDIGLVLEASPPTDQSKAVAGDVYDFDDAVPEDAKVIGRARELLCELVPNGATVQIDVGLGMGVKP